MKERPILMNSEMVIATLDDRKLQTRRIVKPQPPVIFDEIKPIITNAGVISWCFQNSKDADFHGYFKCPYGQVGDRLYVRETWAVCSKHATGCPQTLLMFEYTHFSLSFPDCIQPGYEIVYKAYNSGKYSEDATHWRPSMHMPKWASRIWLEVTNIRVERVRDITNEDAKSEGVQSVTRFGHCGWEVYRDVSKAELSRIRCGSAFDKPRGSFASLWDSIYKKRGFDWEVNPWVWVIEFKRLVK